jgi:hypothetical protein
MGLPLRFAPRAGAAAALACAVAFAPLRAGAQTTCGWIQGITHWNASIAWSWSHQAQWIQLPTTMRRTTTQDAGGGTASLDALLAGQIFLGELEGQLSFDDYSEARPDSNLFFVRTVVSGPIVDEAPGLPSQIILTLDPTACTYTWSAEAFGAGTLTTESGSSAVIRRPNEILPGEHPIPPFPEPLSFSGSVVATVDPELGALDPQFETLALGAQVSADRPNATPFANASVSWSFDPDPQGPVNDTCPGALFLLDGQQQDTTFATTDATDPAASCGAGDRSVWFSFFADANGVAEISTAGSGYSTVVSVWPAAQVCGALTSEVACGANGASVPVQANTAYRVQVQRSSGGGTGALSVTATPESGGALSCAAALGALSLCSRIRNARPAMG